MIGFLILMCFFQLSVWLPVCSQCPSLYFYPFVPLSWELSFNWKPCWFRSIWNLHVKCYNVYTLHLKNFWRFELIWIHVRHIQNILGDFQEVDSSCLRRGNWSRPLHKYAVGNSMVPGKATFCCELGNQTYFRLFFNQCGSFFANGSVRIVPMRALEA